MISGDRTFLQSAIMANDPHRSLQLPSLRYWVHLVAPGWNVIGARRAGATRRLGRAQRARGMGIHDLPDRSRRSLRLRDRSRQSVPLPVSRRLGGHENNPRNDRGQGTARGRGRAEVHAARTGRCTRIRPHHRAYALRAAWLEEGTAPYLASLRLDQATSWAEFREACRSFLTPSENMVWADVDGHIGWQAVGLAPRRKNWDGLMPVPGDGRYEWDGYLPILELPHLADPPRGWFASANQDNLPPGLPFRCRLRVDRPFSVCSDRGSPRLGPAIHTDGYDAVAARRACPAGPVARALTARAQTGPGSDEPGSRPALVVGLRFEPGLGARHDLCGLGACPRKQRSGASSCPRMPGPYFPSDPCRPRS